MGRTPPSLPQCSPTLFYPCHPRHPRSGPSPRGDDVSSPWPPSQPKTFWDETSQPLPTPSITSGLETSRRRGPPRNPKLPGTRRPSPHPDANCFGVGDVSSPHSHALATPVISSGFPLPIPQPVSKTLKGFQTVAGGKAARPPPPVPRPQNVQPPPLAEGVGGGGIPESPQAVSPNPSRCSTIPRTIRPGRPRRGKGRGLAVSPKSGAE